MAFSARILSYFVLYLVYVILPSHGGEQYTRMPRTRLLALFHFVAPPWSTALKAPRGLTMLIEIFAGLVAIRVDGPSLESASTADRFVAQVNQPYHRHHFVAC